MSLQIFFIFNHKKSYSKSNHFLKTKADRKIVMGYLKSQQTASFIITTIRSKSAQSGTNSTLFKKSEFIAAIKF